MELKIGIEGIEMLSFELKPKLKADQAEQYHIDVMVQITPIPSNILALARVNIVVREFNSPEEFSKLSVIVAFKVENFTEAFHIENDTTYTINGDVNRFITSISISTTRGILFNLLKGTYLHKAIIPIIDMKTLIPEG
ncbi:MAG: hypothetical protein WKG06_35455 [Segetibacter sp.]